MLGLGAEFLLGMLSLGLVIQLGAGSPPQPLDCLLMSPPQRTVPFASVSPCSGQKASWVSRCELPTPGPGHLTDSLCVHSSWPRGKLGAAHLLGDSQSRGASLTACWGVCSRT